MTDKNFDRSAEDTSPIIHLEHANVRIPDQRLATIFYMTGLGLTRDPYLMTSIDNMWVNVGRSQFHLPTGDAQVFRGTIGLVIPDRDWLLHRLESAQAMLAGTRFGYAPRNDAIDVTCPWGNRFAIHEPHERFGNNALAMPYICFDVPAGTAERIAQFYRVIFAAPAEVTTTEGAPCAEIKVGRDQRLMFRETDGKIPSYDGHHLQIYVGDFSGPHGRLNERGLVSEESDRWQYRFQEITDLDSGKSLFTIEHEVRSMTHPLYARPLVNRNPYQSNRRFAAGHEERPWALPFEA
jgi:hypothetical protein